MGCKVGSVTVKWCLMLKDDEVLLGLCLRPGGAISLGCACKRVCECRERERERVCVV